MQTMKLTLIGPVYPFRGGIAHYTTQLAQALQRTNNEVQVISFRRQYPAFLYPGKTDRDPSQNPVRVEASYPLDPLFPWTWLRTAQDVLKTQPDGVIFQWWTTFWAIPFAYLAWRFRKNRIRLIFIIHNVVPHEQRPWDVWLARRVLTPNDRYIVQNPKEERILRELTGAQEIRIYTHPVFGFFHQQEINKDEACRQLNLPQDRFVWLFFGLVRPYKGLPVLLEALAKVQASGYQSLLIIAGEFWEDLERVQAKVVELGLTEHVRIDNRYIPDEEVGLYFSAADCLAAPYTGGTQSGAVSIAVSYGLPMIVTDHIARGLPSGEAEGRMTIVPPGDAEALAAAMLKHMRSPQERAAPRPPRRDWEQMAQLVSDMLA